MRIQIALRYGYQGDFDFFVPDWPTPLPRFDLHLNVIRIDMSMVLYRKWGIELKRASLAELTNQAVQNRVMSEFGIGSHLHLL